jgi:hypothetical protein
MGQLRRRPFHEINQYYVYAWFLRNECLYAGYGHAGRCRYVRFKLSQALNISREELVQSVTIVVHACESRKLAQVEERIWIELLKPRFCICPGIGSFKGMLSSESRERIRQAKIGKKPSLATRLKMSQALLGNTRTKGYFENNKFAYGYKHTPEARAKISATSKGRKPSLLCRQKSAERCRLRNITNPPRKGKVCSEEHKRKVKEAALLRYQLKRNIQ